MATAMETLRVERRDDGTALVTIARPAKLNAMNHAFFHEIRALMAELDDDDGVSVAVITGEGRAFSAGGDLEDFHRVTDTPSARRQVRLAIESFLAVERAETVVIGAVNGIAYGGGTELTLACDLAFAAQDARFAFREITLGLMPGYGLVRGPEIIGRDWTHRMALTGDILDADQARAIGLVQEVHPPGDLVDAALAIGARMAAHPQVALRATKRFVNRHSPAGIAETIEATALLMAGPERVERVRALVSR
ncbi:enoyl-CoA hydratase/isomerase family protein [Baekduia soli]|uniref:Enoyl-CoA hydratase/isomerase family protein n=1 Tax=Baekduia soli TaxID=496014 RepID=A0A5B8UC28_9ACTN|nr:enoyl-CoA hydratase/isomerase family protein [Baekduia soli]QEC50544.1 enoyl-CoA hydratase/isomerase family protein [Baekduia soli]